MHFRAVLWPFTMRQWARGDALGMVQCSWLNMFDWKKKGENGDPASHSVTQAWVNQQKVCSVLSPCVVGSSSRPRVNMKGATLGGAGCPLEKEEESLPFQSKTDRGHDTQGKKGDGNKSLHVRASRVHKYDLPWRNQSLKNTSKRGVIPIDMRCECLKCYWMRYYGKAPTKVPGTVSSYYFSNVIINNIDTRFFHEQSCWPPLTVFLHLLTVIENQATRTLFWGTSLSLLRLKNKHDIICH